MGSGIHDDLRREQAFRIVKLDPPGLTGSDHLLRQHPENDLGMNGGDDPGSATLPEANLIPRITFPDARIAIAASLRIRVPPSALNREINASAKSDPRPRRRQEDKR